MPDLTRTSVRAILFALAALFVLALIVAGYNAITAKPKAEARLGHNQAEAAQASGHDAANAVGAAAAREAAGDALTRSNEKEIRNAAGADAPVDPAVRDAGLRSLCRRAAYRRDPQCVQFAPAR